MKEEKNTITQEKRGNAELPTLFHLIVLRHEGETSEGQFDGEGVAYFDGGHVYKGMFSRGLMDGFGVFMWSDGLKYEGEFVCNIPMGQGTYNWPDGSSYKGNVHNGIRHGIGTYVCPKSCVSYEGHWDQGKRHGKGTMYYNQDKTSWYKGDWVKNNREGSGVRCYASGNIYSGEWKNNRRHGQGTMRWLKLGQQYSGEWMDGVQHGRGTHVWILRRSNWCHYSQSNQYTGDFVQGQRHGQGIFYYAGGAVYEGEWKNNKKHGKSKFTFKDGHLFEGEFVDDQMLMPGLQRNRAPTPLCDSDSSTLDVPLNIECVLDKIPERKRNTERKQVEFVVLWKNTELRSIYSFYSGLGHTQTSLLSRMQLWRLLKDCKIHHHGITLAHIDHLIKEDGTTEVHSPFTPMLLRSFISCLVIVAYHIYNKDMASPKNLLAACLSKMLTDDILPNAKNVKGFLFGQPDHSVVSLAYMKRCWEIYQVYCRVNAAPGDDQTMTYRHLLWMFKDLYLLDNNLSTSKLLEIITAESWDSNNPSSCLDLEITFLEFFEVLLGCAKVKCQLVSEDLEECQSPSGFNTEVEVSRRPVKITSIPSQSIPAPVNSPITPEITSPQSVEIGKSSATCALDVGSLVSKVSEEPQFAEHTEMEKREGKGMKTGNTEAKHCELELWAQSIHQFFNHFFYPAFEHDQLVTRYMKQDKLHQEPQRCCTLEKAQQRPT
ncbi:radial spoke head 10 homolog B isoform X2 [Anabas testudineus]|uniref:Radial spoke head 10 homolog B2 n=1 Tax=Anabas testudineus TaxID=64144 RepID=A0A7N6A5Y5_ANATE|nr:radial spoke head 10 homolog B isoform X2 [Anabas testudineus]